jgi:hypothetical protein
MVLAFIKPEVYGAFPTDPYSYAFAQRRSTTWNDWASKDILTRKGELE